MKKWIFLLLLPLAGCANVEKPDPGAIVSEKIVEKVTEVPVPQPMLGQLKEIEDNKPAKARNTGTVLENGLQEARQKPSQERFFNSIMLYDYMPGALYQVYTAPFKLTDIMLEPGEKITQAPQAGDTIRWMVAFTNSGDGAVARQHITIKPVQSNLKTNMLITTDRRVYNLELTSFKNSYMNSVAWNYPINQPLQETSKNNDGILNSSIDKLNFNYGIKTKRGRPNWVPTRVFDDGQKTYIQFSEKVNQSELPALFLLTNESKLQLVNYRYKHGIHTMVIDRLIQTAELRLGKRRPQVVRITNYG